MVNYSAAPLDLTFSALSHPIRREIINQLTRGSASIKKLATPFDISLPGFLKHIKILEDAGLVTTTKNGRVRYCQLNAGPMQDAAEWLAVYEQFWNLQLDALDEYLEETK
jgi:DNA-binding transcriptional ArsR family regulator